MGEPLLLKADDAAARLGISRAYLYRLLAAGTLPSVRLGARCRRVPLAALEAWVRQHGQPATAPTCSA